MRDGDRIMNQILKTKSKNDIKSINKKKETSSKRIFKINLNFFKLQVYF